MSDPQVLKTGHSYQLIITELTEQGAMVDAFALGELFIPKSQLPDEVNVGDSLKVFLYNDRDRVLATAKHPYLEYGMVGMLRVNAVDNGTAYLDLGIPKELVLPVSEQLAVTAPMDMVTVYVSRDEQGRLFASERFNRFISDTAPKGSFKHGQKVTLVAVAKTPLGIRTVVNDRFFGLIYQSEQKGEIRFGKRYDGYVLSQRPDGKLDVTLQMPGREGIEHAASDLLKILNANDGYLEFTDKSPAADIEDYLHMSKGRFKKALGHLYKLRYVEIKEHGIELTMAGEQAMFKVHQQN